jgi:hypothetical protein
MNLQHPVLLLSAATAMAGKCPAMLQASWSGGLLDLLPLAPGASGSRESLENPRDAWRIESQIIADCRTGVRDGARIKPR